jgi:hypothetical protein
MVSNMNGADKAAAAKAARDRFGVVNIMRAGEHADALIEMIKNRDFAISNIRPLQDDEEPF